ncbi:DUF2771 family protein [Pseudonocardia humida]|uniref:DUF2771 family protein n=1 Tax=Pseudonocardia humida TaxID=2800819 RepID=A0ABT1A1F2_9PSEU|nr:DUF2771 family protein [Pseudonocardia humida]MCO1656813.1 DUF2771 family protein [Pseudonocardia humida]
MPRRTAIVAALATGLLATACADAPPPQVTFAAGTASVTAAPTQYCDIDLSECAEPGAPAELAVPGGTALQITVPDEVADAPWHVVFSYRDDTGQQVDERSRLFAPDTGSGYTLQLPTPTAQLLEAQVQQFGPAPQMDPQTQEIQFPVRASWVVRTGA